jgi:hypothetical protein
MKTTTNHSSDARALAHGRVPARPELDSLADLLTAYRGAAMGPAPRPSAALSARVDLTATPIAMQRDVVAVSDIAGVGARRAVGGLFGLGVTVAIILGAASGAAAVVSMGTAGLLPPGAQGVFDQVVSDIVPLGVVDEETTDQGEAPGVPTDSTTTPEPTEVPTPVPSLEPPAVVPGPVAVDPGENEAANSVEDTSNDDGSGTPGENNGAGNSGTGNSGNSGSGNADTGKKNDDKKNDKNDKNEDKKNGNSGNGNSGKKNG